MTTPLLLLPGTLCDERLFSHQVEEFGAESEVHIGDLTRSDTIAGMAEDVLDDAPPRFALAGLSLGGIVAMEIMRQAPERVERLALLDTNPRPPTDAQQKAWDRFAAMVDEGRFSEITSEILLPKLAWRHDELAELIVGMAESIGPDAFLKQNAAQPTRPDSRISLADVDCPTLILYGEMEEICTPEMHNEIAAAIPDADLVVIPDAGHLATLDNPSAVNAAMRAWMAKTTSPVPVASSDNGGRSPRSAETA